MTFRALQNRASVRVYRGIHLAIALAIVGCAESRSVPSSPPTGNEKNHANYSQLHALYVDRKGYATTEELWLAGSFETRAWHSAERNVEDENARIDAVVEHLQKELANCGASHGSAMARKNRNTSNKKEIFLFIHGGLNTNETSFERTRKLLGRDDFASDCRFPIFVNWRSGPFSSYKDHLIKVRRGKDGGLLAKLTSPLYSATDLAEATVGTPKAWMTQGAHNFRTNIGKNFQDYEDLPPCDQSAGFVCRPTLNFECGTGSNDRTTRSAIWSGSTPFKAAITPLVFNVGKPAWDVMLHRTNMLLWKECSFNGNCEANEHTHVNDSLGEGPLSKPIRRISAINDLRENYEITLVGHSMGTIIINRIVSTLPSLPIKNIVFLASADSIRNTHYSVLQFVGQRSDVRFYSWMLHPDNESRELAWLGMVLSGSLFTWIDNMFSTPESLLDYRFGRWNSVKELPELFTEEVQLRTRLMVFPRDDDDVPHEHGDFGDCKFWKLEKIEELFTS